MVAISGRAFNQPIPNPMKRILCTFVAGVAVMTALYLSSHRAAAQAANDAAGTNNPSEYQKSQEAYRASLKQQDELAQQQVQRGRQAADLLKQQEAMHARAEALFVKQEEMIKRQEADLDRYDKILDTWEKQQKQYQKYLDSLGK